jgi:hypothetical protein
LDLIIRHALELAPESLASRVGGTIQSDAAALTTPDTKAAITVGRLIFRETFRRSGSLETGRERIWIRGAIQEMAESNLEDTEALPAAASGISKRILSDDLLEAINVEQSGYKGQRLLVPESLIDRSVEEFFRIPVGRTDFFFPLASLPRPDSKPGYRDVLWMFPNGKEEDIAEEWRLMLIAMANRLRWAGQGGDAEFLHAAATQLVFTECNAILHNIPESGGGRN